MHEQGRPTQHREPPREQRGVVIHRFELGRDGAHRVPAPDGAGRRGATREECMRAHPSSQHRPLHLV
jgi:hypothetical protein